MFRLKENIKKLKYILWKTSVTEEVMDVAQSFAISSNSYHNFGHELGVAENIIFLSAHANISPRETDLLTIAALFHDAEYDIKEKNPEIKGRHACEIIDQNLPREDCPLSSEELAIIKEVVMATKQHRTHSSNELINIMRDADMGLFGRWPQYLLFSSMGFLEEKGGDIQHFLEYEQQYIDQHKVNGEFFLSDAGKTFYQDPDATLQEIAQRPKERIQKAYELRKVDIEWQDFVETLEQVQ